MGLLRDAIKSATGANKPNNGLGGPSLPWSHPPSTRRNDASGSQGYNSQSYDDESYYNESYNYPSYSNQLYRDQAYYDTRWNNKDPPPYDCVASQSTRNNIASSPVPRATASNNSFQPLGLPQIAHGDGQPFVRGWNHQLAYYGISEAEFIGIVDAINVAIIPNPENQIFQKGANIAGWFL